MRIETLTPKDIDALRPPRLETLTANDFDALKNGTHHFSYQYPDGKIQGLNIHIDKARARIRHGQFDIWISSWALRSEHDPEFGSSVLPIRAKREDFGTAMLNGLAELTTRLFPFPVTTSAAGQRRLRGGR